MGERITTRPQDGFRGQIGAKRPVGAGYRNRLYHQIYSPIEPPVKTEVTKPYTVLYIDPDCSSSLCNEDADPELRNDKEIRI